MGRRRARRGIWPWWGWALLIALAPILSINLAVAVCGESLVFPLSPFYLEQKVNALQRYFHHRRRCLFVGHGELGPVIAEAAKRHGLPPGYLESVIEIESETKPHRISRAGAMGPGQLTWTTAQMLGVADPFDPATAIDASARYLAANLRRFGSVELAAAAYNAGPGAVHGAVPRNGETEFYVARIMAEYARRRPPTPAASPIPATLRGR